MEEKYSLEKDSGPVIRGKIFAPGPLVAGTRIPGGPITYRFYPLNSSRPEPHHEIVEMWLCPHGSHGGEPLSIRSYPDLDPPSIFADCTDCCITWELEINKTNN